MRILSQCAEEVGVFNVPYELCVVSIGENKKTGNACIYVRCNLFGEYSVVAANYSSIEKANKAMEMLLEQYEKLCNLEIYLHGGIELFAKPISRGEADLIEYKNINVFQFPQDNEIEV